MTLERVAYYHFPRLWAQRNDEHEHVFADGSKNNKAQRRKSLRLLIEMMRREKEEHVATLIICRGLQASGKTTRARAWVAEDVPNRARVNRDDLRSQLHNGVWMGHQTEPRIAAARDAMIDTLLRVGVSVVSDDTNLPQQVARHLARLARRVGASVEVWDMTDVDLETCLKRDAARNDGAGGVGEKVIRDTYDRFLRGTDYPLSLPVDAEATPVEPYVPNTSLPPAWIVDLDGTLALMNGRGRGPFDWARVGEDACNEAVRDLVWAIDSTINRVVILSGRDEVCRPQTEAWLREHEIDCDQLHMRPAGDQRKDAVVKLELFREHVEPYYNVRGVIDDREQVVAMWRELGLTCAQVAPGNF